LKITLSKCPSHISLRIVLRLVIQGTNAGKHACVFKFSFSGFICLFLCQCSGFAPLYRVGWNRLRCEPGEFRSAEVTCLHNACDGRNQLAWKASEGGSWSAMNDLDAESHDMLETFCTKVGGLRKAAKWELRSFWVIAQRVVLISNRRFGTAYRSHLQQDRWRRDRYVVPRYH